MSSFEEGIYSIKEENFSQILKCLLDRIPILIAGNDDREIEFFANNLADLMNFREKLLFNTDFISKNELSLILQEEEADYDIKRSLFICPNNALQKVIQKFDSFKSWILCFNINEGRTMKKNETINSGLRYIIKMIQKKEKNLLLIENIDNDIKVNMFGRKFKSNDFKFERRIYNKAIKFVDNSIVKMRRIFDQHLSSLNNFSSELKEELLDFNFEQINLKKNMFKIQILEFYNAARRAFSILNKISILNSLNIDIEISDKTLLDTISYTETNYSRLIEFIEVEWGENFSEQIDSEPIKYKHDLIEGLWG